MGGQDGVVGLNYCRCHLGSGVNGKFQFGLLAVVHRETLHKKGGESRASSSAKGMEKEESLEPGALVSKFTDTVQDKINNLLADGVVAPGVVVGGVLLACDELLGVEELAVDASPDLVNNSWLEIHEDGSGNMFSRSSFLSAKSEY